MAKDDNEHLDTDTAPAFWFELTGEQVKSKTIANWRQKGNVFRPGDWHWFGRTAVTTKGVLRRVAQERAQAEPTRRRNARKREELTQAVTTAP